MELGEVALLVVKVELDIDDDVDVVVVVVLMLIVGAIKFAAVVVLIGPLSVAKIDPPLPLKLTVHTPAINVTVLAVALQDVSEYCVAVTVIPLNVIFTLSEVADTHFPIDHTLALINDVHEESENDSTTTDDDPLP
jgi:hypothetical protein